MKVSDLKALVSLDNVTELDTKKLYVFKLKRGVSELALDGLSKWLTDHELRGVVILDDVEVFELPFKNSYGCNCVTPDPDICPHHL